MPKPPAQNILLHIMPSIQQEEYLSVRRYGIGACSWSPQTQNTKDKRRLEVGGWRYTLPFVLAAAQAGSEGGWRVERGRWRKRTSASNKYLGILSEREKRTFSQSNLRM